MSNPKIAYKNDIVINADSIDILDTWDAPIATATGFSIENIKDYRPYTFYKTEAFAHNVMKIIFTSAEAKTADYIGICGHNLNDPGEYVPSMQVFYWNEALSDWRGASDLISVNYYGSVIFVPFREAFTSTKFMVFIQNLPDIAEPIIGTLFLGEALEMPYPPEAPYTPISKSIVTHTARSKTGQLLGSSVRFKPIEIDATFRNLDASFVEGAYRTFWETHASEFLPFFWHYLDQTYYVALKQEAVFSAPRNMSLYVSEIQLPMTGLDNI